MHKAGTHHGHTPASQEDSFAVEMDDSDIQRHGTKGGWRYRGPPGRPTLTTATSTHHPTEMTLMTTTTTTTTMAEMCDTQDHTFNFDGGEEEEEDPHEMEFANYLRLLEERLILEEEEVDSACSEQRMIDQCTPTDEAKSMSVSRGERYSRTILDRGRSTAAGDDISVPTKQAVSTTSKSSCNGNVFASILPPPLRPIKARPVKKMNISMMNIMKESFAVAGTPIPSSSKVGDDATTTLTVPTQMQTANSSATTMMPLHFGGRIEQPTASVQQGVNDDTHTSTTSTIIDNDEDRYLKLVSTEISYKKLMNQSPYSLTDIEWDVLIQRFLDNLEDMTQKQNGKFSGKSMLQGKLQPRDNRKTVIVLGTGWSAHAFVQLASIYDLRIVVVSPVNHFVFTPMLASAAVGTVEYRSMTEPIRVTNPYIDNFVEGRAIGIDVLHRKLQVQLTSLSTVTGVFKGIASDVTTSRLDPEPVLTHIVYGGPDGSTIERDSSQGAGDVIELSYDHLLCCVGTASRSAMVRGAKDYCFNLKTSQDSKRLRTAIGEALEMASRPDVQEYYYTDEKMQEHATKERRRRVRIAVVGGGPTGVELCGELCDLFSQVCRTPDGAYQRLRGDVSVMLVHGGPDLLPSMDGELRDRALLALQSQGVEVRLNTRLNEVGRDYIKIVDKVIGVEETVPLAITVWAAGNVPVPFIGELLAKLPVEAAGSGGRVNVDPWLRCPTPNPESFGTILVLGDAACLEYRSKYDTSPKPLPQTAQVAGQQGAFVARMLNRGYDMCGTPPALVSDMSDPVSSYSSSLLNVWLLARGLADAPKFQFLSLGLLAYVGQEEALNQVMVGDVPLFNYSGKIAFALWRSVYLSKQASTRNQALIAFDWLRTETFGRDITRL